VTWAPLELQKTIYEELTADVTLMALISGVFDSTSVPQDQAFPYVTIGDGPMEDRSNHTWRGHSADLTIHVWYRESGRGRKKVQQIQAEIDRILHAQDICVDGWNIVSFRQRFVDVIVDNDDVTLHGIQIFNLLIGEA